MTTQLQAAEMFEPACFPSPQLLDCFGIPVLMALSWFILRARYKVIHFIAVFVCLLGVGTMVGADILAGREDNSGETQPRKCVFGSVWRSHTGRKWVMGELWKVSRSPCCEQVHARLLGWLLISVGCWCAFPGTLHSL